LATLILNFKNYPEILGAGSLKLAEAAESVAKSSGAEVIVAPPTPMLSLVASKVKIPVFSQSVGGEEGDKTTGAVLPEAVKGAHAEGTILNHSESRRPEAQIVKLVPRLRGLSLRVCLCANSAPEAARLARLGTEYVAIEPPELIGTGVAVSKARPDLVTRTVSAVRGAGFKGSVLCGAGIVDGRDVSRAIELGADGVLVSSSVVKAKDWTGKLDELARSLK
jgi:triosephosphate isomerase